MGKGDGRPVPKASTSHAQSNSQSYANATRGGQDDKVAAAFRGLVELGFVK
jgi:hypothetical protein